MRRLVHARLACSRLPSRTLPARLRARLTAQDDERGIALVMVIGVSLVVALLAVSAVAYAVGSQRRARDDQDWNAAMAAAFAGVEEYQSRLANDPGYFAYGNPGSRFTTETGSQVTEPQGEAVNDAFGLGPNGPWATVAGSGGAASFRYEVDNSQYYASGTLRIRVTGRARGETRSLTADLRQRGFIDFLYFTNYEMQDPVISGASPTSCERYRYEGRSTTEPPNGCGTINFRTGDVIDGPMHTNDGFQVNGSPVFKGWTTTSYNPSSGPRYYTNGSVDPKFPAMPDGKPLYEPVLAMPATNSELKKETRPDLPQDVPRPGCLYTGPTTITFEANGKMRVRSPWTRYTSPVAGTNNPGCGTPGSGGLGATDGQEIDAPDNNVVFVQNVPTVSSDANYWALGATNAPVCLAEDHGSSNGRNAAGNPVGYPAAGEYVANASVYGCRNGDLFVEGTVNAKATLAAENYIYITDDLVYANAEDDILGLVGQNAVWVWKPERQTAQSETKSNQSQSQASTLEGIGYSCTKSTWGSSYTCTGRKFGRSNQDLDPDNNRRVDAAILSVAHTFMVQNYDRGAPRGSLTVNGAIAQKYRGTVGTGDSNGNVTTGYLKDYKYDRRFGYVAPPKFLSPTSTTYGVNVWVEVSPVFGADGAYR